MKRLRALIFARRLELSSVLFSVVPGFFSFYSLSCYKDSDASDGGPRVKTEEHASRVPMGASGAAQTVLNALKAILGHVDCCAAASASALMGRLEMTTQVMRIRLSEDTQEIRAVTHRRSRIRPFSKTHYPAS